MKIGYYMALAVAMMLFTMLYGAYQGQPNHPVLTRYTGVNPYRDARTIEFENFYRPVGCAFEIYTRNDPNSMVVDVNIPGFTVIEGGTVPDANGTGYLTEWRFDFVPPDPNRHNVDVRTTGTTCRPQIRLGRGIVKAPLLDSTYDYTLAKTDPQEHQKAVKHTQRYWYLTGQPILYNVRF
jgi:hypothetical protein